MFIQLWKLTRRYIDGKNRRCEKLTISEILHFSED